MYTCTCTCSYKQQKFNLFREESEGYSKLVSELAHERRPLEAVPAILDNIRSLIGEGETHTFLITLHSCLPSLCPFLSPTSSLSLSLSLSSLSRTVQPGP